MKMKLALLCAMALLVASAWTAAASEDTGRYTFAPAGSEFLRLDSVTGAVAACRRKLGGWTCESVQDEVPALKEEIERLTREMDDLKEKLARAEDRLKEAEETHRPAGPSFYVQTPSREEITAFVDELKRRLRELLRDLKEEDQVETEL